MRAETKSFRFHHLTWIVALASLLGAFAWVRLQIVQISYSIHEMEKEEKILRDETNKLTYKINEAKAPHRLEKLAKLKFNLRVPTPGQVLILSAEDEN